MAQENKVGSIPDFTDTGTQPMEVITDEGRPDPPEDTPKQDTPETPQQDTPEGGQQAAPESGVQTTEEPSVDKEKDTPPDPPQDDEPTGNEQQPPSGDIDEDLRESYNREIEGLKETRRELIHELKELRGERREAKQRQIDTVDEKIDTLEDVNPADVELIERIMKVKGYVSQPEMKHMINQSKKDDELNKFLSEFPEYNEENDPDKRKFGPLLREVQLYKDPEDPAMYGRLLRKAHRAITRSKPVSDRGSAGQQKRQAEVAGVGSGGTQRSSTGKSLSQEKRIALLNGGWSEEDIQRMEDRLSE